MKLRLLRLLVASGAFAPFRLANRRKALIVTYHRFGSDSESEVTSARNLEEQLAHLTSRYTIVPLSFVVRRLHEGRPLPPRLAVVTVDDGYRDVYEIAFPLFRRYRVPATVFVVTGYLDGRCWVWTDKARYLLHRTRADNVEATIAGKPFIAARSEAAAWNAAPGRINALLKALPDEEKENALDRLSAMLDVPLPAQPPDCLRSITWQEAREMAAAGIEIGSHTVTHPILTHVDAERLRRELSDSRTRIKALLDADTRLFCYPCGCFDRRVKAAAARAGYLGAVTTVPGFNSRSVDPLALRRIHTDRDLPHFVQRISGFEQVKDRVRALTALPVLHRHAYASSAALAKVSGRGARR